MLEIKEPWKKKTFALLWKKSCQGKHLNSTLCQGNWEKTRHTHTHTHKDLISNLKTVLIASQISFTLKMAMLTMPKYYKIF